MRAWTVDEAEQRYYQERAISAWREGIQKARRDIDELVRRQMHDWERQRTGLMKGVAIRIATFVLLGVVCYLLRWSWVAMLLFVGALYCTVRLLVGRQVAVLSRAMASEFCGRLASVRPLDDLPRGSLGRMIFYQDENGNPF